MTFFAAAPLISLFFFSNFAVAVISAPDCSPTWEWAFNSLEQCPCTMAANMMATCYEGSYTIHALTPGYVYGGPTGPDDSTLCDCSTVGYSLLSACGGCQGGTWISWPQYAYNCTTIMAPGWFPNPIPNGTRLPQWPLLDVTIQRDNTWNFNDSYAVRGNPELGPGTIPGPSASESISTNTYPSTPASSSLSHSSSSSYSRGPFSNSATPSPIVRHSSNVGAIAGGVAGSIAAISFVIAVLLFYLRRQLPPAPSAWSASNRQPSGFNSLMDQVPRSVSESGQGTFVSSLPETTSSMLGHYNPDDPTTYPTYQGTSPPGTSSRNLYTVATAPNSQGQGLGYHGLPIV